MRHKPMGLVLYLEEQRETVVHCTPVRSRTIEQHNTYNSDLHLEIEAVVTSDSVAMAGSRFEGSFFEQ